MCRMASFNNKTTFEVCRTPPLLEQHETGIVDSGCTIHFLLVTAPCLNNVKSRNPLRVKDGHLITWPGLTEDAINKHLKLTPATAMGHMSQRRQNIRSTSKAPTEKQQPPDTYLGTKTHLLYAFVVDQGQLYTDLTGKFPVRSSKGNS
jgi:hypothetical protein